MRSNAQLQRELKKKHAFRSPEQEVCLNIMRTSDLLQNQLGRFFREYGLTSSQYNVLRILRGAGEPMPSLEIAERLIQVVPAITGLIDRLENQGFVKRRRCEEDRRIVYVEITKEAKELLKRMDKPLDELHLEQLGHMTRAELKQLSTLLEKARSTVDA